MGISMWQLLIVLLIVALLFGTKKLKNIGGDLGSAIRGFKKAMGEDDSKENKDSMENKERMEEKPEDPKLEQKPNNGQTIEGTTQRTAPDSETKQG